MSSEQVSEGDQFPQRSNEDSKQILTPSCSTPAVHGSRTLSPRSDALSKDSGISQVFSLLISKKIQGVVAHYLQFW